MLDKLSIADNFSRYAHLYDNYADVQTKAAFELADSIKNNNFSNILEIGCGTGNYTLILRDRFKATRIKSLDISEKMVSLAKHKLKNKDVEFIVADGTTLNLDVVGPTNFDLITSNACFQWFDSLRDVLRAYLKLLQEKGVIYFSIFGPHTFCELNTALMHVCQEQIDSAHFCDRYSLETMLKDSFNSVKIKEIHYQETFASLKKLLEKIKYSGIRGNGLAKKVYFSRGLLEKLERAYLDKFQEIRATYQVFFCQGEKQ